MKLSKVKFMEFSRSQELSENEQMLILGGYTTNESCCFYVESGSYTCTSSPSDASDGAGGYRTWACNTDEAKKRCGC